MLKFNASRGSHRRAVYPNPLSAFPHDEPGRVPPSNRNTRFLAAIALGIALTLSAHAQNNSWRDGSGKWETSTNWSLGFPPSGTDSADYITNASSKVVTVDSITSSSFPATMTISNLILSATAGQTNTLRIMNADSTPFIMNTLLVGQGGFLLVSNTSLTIASAETITNGTMVVLNTTAVPELLDSTNFLFTVTGPSAVFSNAGAVAFANAASNMVLVADGARLDTGDLYVGFKLFDVIPLPANFNTVTITGSNSVVNVGTLSIGTIGSSNQFIISNGGTLRLKGFLRLSSDSTSQSNLVRLLPGGTLIVGSSVFVGNATNAQASMEISGGTSLIGTNLIIGGNSASTGLVTMTGGSITVTNGVLAIGNDGSLFSTGGVGHVTVSGGLLQAASILVGDNLGSASSLTVSSNGHVVVHGGLRVNGNHTTTVTGSSTLEVLVGPPPLFEDPSLNNRIVVAYGADGTLIVSNGTVNAPEMVIGLSAGNTGSLVMNGGVMNLSSNLLIGLNASATGVVTISGGTLTVTNGTFGIGSTGGVAQATVSGGLVQAASILVGDNFGSPSSFAVAGTGHVVVQGGLRVNGNHTTTINGGTLDVLVGPSPAFEDPVLRNRIVVAYGADGTLIVSNGAVRTPALVVSVSAGNTGTLALPGGITSVFSNMTVGLVGCTSTGIVTVAGGSLYVTNGGTAVLEVRSGTFTLSAGTVVVDKLVVTNACARLLHTGGTLVYSQLVLDPNLSAVGDGIRNAWKQQYGFDPFNPNLASADADGDGFSNLQEYLAGTDPTNNASAFRITSVTRTGSNVAVTWTMGSGKTNAVQFANGANYTTNFTDLFTVTNTVGPVTNYVDVGGATNHPARFYRIRLVP